MVRQKALSLFRRARLGIAAVEFALTLPIWTTLLLGVSDGTYYLLVNEKADRVAYTVTDVVTQNTSLSMATLTDIFSSAAQIMQPFPFAASGGNVVVSSFYLQSGQASIQLCWQKASNGGSPTNDIAISGSTITFPTGETLTINPNENVIVSEVYYNFKPMFLGSGLFHSGQVYRMAVFKPRLSLLIYPPT